MLLVHSLEHAENPRETLKEIWRVLSPAGRRRHRGAQPARRLGALRAHAVRHRPAVFARPAQRAAARNQFHAGRLERGAVLPAVEAALDDALPPHAGAQRPAALADLFRRHRRRSAEAALPGHAGRPARLAPRLRAGAVAAGRDADGAQRPRPDRHRGLARSNRRRTAPVGHNAGDRRAHVVNRQTRSVIGSAMR